MRPNDSSQGSCSSITSKIAAIDERLDRIAVEIAALAGRLCRNRHTGVADFVVPAGTYQLPRGNAVVPAVLRQIAGLVLVPNVPLFVGGAVFDGVLWGLKLEMPEKAHALRPSKESRLMKGRLAEADAAAASGGKAIG
jgi:hypothetical protein